MKSIISSDFNSNVVKLILGTGLAQVFPLALMPILTRIYSPEDFGVFAIYMALAGILGVIATGRYELAIVLPDTTKDASDVFWLCIVISIGLSVISGLTMLFSNDMLVQYLDLPEETMILYLIPVSIFFAGLLQSLNYYYVRNKLFGNLSVSKVVMSSGTVSSQATIGVATNASGYGLTMGYLLGQISSVLYLILKTKKVVKIHRSTFQNMQLVARKYKKYPIISGPAALLDTAAIQLPLLIINKVYATSIAGQFSLAIRIINLPLALIGPAVSQVLLQKMASSDHENPEEIRRIVLFLALKLALLISPLCIMSLFFGEDIFVFIFSEDWRIAGSFAFPLSLVVSFRFIVSPLSSVLSVERNLKYGVFWQVGYFVATLICLGYASQFSVEKFLFIFVLNEFFLYLIYFLLILKGTNSYRYSLEN
tara:strand:+ start:782 stop:2053 length:1272 start_codon:yes stop_codon:yes gene_type:complete